MGVTIDSLQIEIQSSSANAAQGIDALATSLEKLKKNGAFKTVSTNLDRLSLSLKGLQNVYQASNSLRNLANSIEKLKGVGTVASLANSLKKLPEALKSISNIDLDRVAPQLQKLAETVAPLSAIKAGGLGTMVNAMKNLGKLDFGEITKNLEGDAINDFIAKVAKLNEELGPLSEKMTSIKAGFNAVNSGARKAASGVKELGEGVDASKLNMASFIEIIRTAYDAFQGLIQKFQEYIGMAVEWDGIAARFGRGFGEQAQDTYDWVKRLNEEMGINVQQFMQYSSVYATMLTGFGVASKDASTMALGYAELTYDIWAGYNDIYKTFDEAAEAVRSAIAGEVEPVRRAGFTIIESTLQQTAANHGLEISLENATEAQKSYLRYLTLVDQAHSQSLVGTYAKEMNTAEGLLRTLSQQMKSLAQTFGSLFLPILVITIPYVQAFVELLSEAVYWLAGLFGVDIQPVEWGDFDAGAGAIDNVTNSANGATGALDSATKAAKELKNATLGIDELNVISPNSASGGGGSGGSGGGSGAGGGFSGLDIDSLWDETIFDDIQSDVEAIKAKMKDWLPIIGTVAGAIAGIRLVNLLTDMEKLKNLKIVSFFTDTAESFGKITKHIKEFFSAAKQLAPEVGWLAALFPKLSTALSAVGTFLAGISAPVWVAIAAAIVAVGSAIYFLVENWDEMTKVVKDFFKENIAPKLEEIGKHFEKIKEALGPVYDFFVMAFGWLADVGLPAVGKAFEWLGGIVVGLVGGALAGLINAIASILEGVVQVASGIIQTVRGLVDLIIGIFTLDGEKIKEAAQKIVGGVADVFGGLYDATIGAVVEFVKGVIDWFVKMWDELVGHSIVPDTINAIVEWFTGLPGKILGVVGDFVKGVIDKFKDLGSGLSEKFSSAWESVKTWWSKKPSLSTYTPTIGNIASKLSSAWESAKTWWKDKKSALSTYTPSIGKIWEKLKSAWTSAKDWWNEKRSSLSYTPSIGSISSKLSSAWTSAKNWWNKSRSSLSYTPSIGSITDKVKSAWNSAKSWWNKNVGGLSTKLNISVPKLTVNWGEVSALGKTFKYPKSFSVKFAADGGIFDKGSLIWAGERGPEIMAKAAGGRTGVMNVQQMQDAVYEGVYSAVVTAMRGMNGGGTQAVNVYLDGRQITATVEQRQHERGASIMGNEVYSY